jgi:UDPglucose 6-dehydrogenase
MQEALEEVRGTNLFFDTDQKKAIAAADVVLVSVSTPLKHGGFGAEYAPDLQHWEKMARLIAECSTSSKIIVERSTVPIKTADLISKILANNSPVKGWTVLSNPEFAREGSAMLDHASPERVMIGCTPDDVGRAAASQLVDIYKKWVPADKIMVSDLWSAELAKLASNAFLAQRISSINSISALCERTGADVNEVAYAIGVDSRIGRKHLQASVGFGGACYETHLRNLIYLCRHYRLHEVAKYWESVIKMNDWQKKRFADKITSTMFSTISGKKLAILGFAYKKNTSDTRQSVAIDVCKALLAEQAKLAVHDPRVSSEAVSLAFTDVQGNEEVVAVDTDPYVCCANAHAIVVLTEWDSFTRLDYRRIFDSMQRPAFVFDGRNLLDHDLLRTIGFTVFGIGKPSPAGLSAQEKEAAALNEAAQRARIKAGAARR